jgi:RimJ/RimL family protein N-acetyltransferase
MELDLNVLRRGIDGPRCRLVPLDESHTAHVVAWRNDPGIARWFVTQARFSVEGHREWLEARRNSASDFNWFIESSGGEPLGTVAIYAVDPAARSAEFGRLLIGDPKQRRLGFARDATDLAIALAGKAGLLSLTLEVKSDNVAAIRLYEQTGFSVHLARDGLLLMRHDMR